MVAYLHRGTVLPKAVREASVAIEAWIHKYIRAKWWDGMLICAPISIAVELNHIIVRAWMSNYIPCTTVNVSIYLCPKPIQSMLVQENSGEKGSLLFEYKGSITGQNVCRASQRGDYIK